MQSSRKNPSSSSLAAWAVCVFLLFAVSFVFGETCQNKFVNYDDIEYVQENPHVVSGLNANNVAWAFTTRYGDNWIPLTWLSFMLTCQTFGSGPWGQHFINLLLHAAAAITFFLVLRRMTGRLWPSAFVAVLFAIHPLRVESVAWVVERKDVLSGVFFMLTLGAYTGYASRPSWIRYITVVVCFALGLMAKPMLVTMPFVLLLLDYWPLQRFGQSDDISARTPREIAKTALRLIGEKIPLLLMAGGSCTATVWAQKASLISLERISTPWRIGNALVADVAYLGQLFYPVGLAVVYPHPGNALQIWKIAAAIAVLIIISAIAAVLWRRPYVMVGWLWYLGMLVPVIGLMQVGAQAMADRYTYLPQIGIGIIVAWGFADLSQTWPHRRWICGAVSAVIFTTLMGIAWQQTFYWRDSETLWTRSVACSPQNAFALRSRGITLQQAGRIDEAVADYEAALAIHPDGVVYNNLGIILASRGKLDEAFAYFQKAVQFAPDCADAHNNLGRILVERDKFNEAIVHFRKAVQIEPNNPVFRQRLGDALHRQGK
jgi:hypothetical protein